MAVAFARFAVLMEIMCFSRPSAAEPGSGQHLVSVDFGRGLEVGGYDYTYGLTRDYYECSGCPTYTGGAQYLYRFGGKLKDLSLGAGFNYTSGSEFVLGSFGDPPENHFLMTYFTSWSLEAVMRYDFLRDPDLRRINLYLLVGAGLGHIGVRTTSSGPDDVDRTHVEGDATGYSLTPYGAGIDVKITKSLFVGIDSRVRFVVAKKQFTDPFIPKSSPELRGVLTGIVTGKIGWTFGGP